MAQDPNFERKPLLCPKCQSPRMVIQEIREMWENPRPSGAMPAFNACFQQRILCADCGEIVWPEKQGGLPGKSAPAVNDQEPDNKKG